MVELRDVRPGPVVATLTKLPLPALILARAADAPDLQRELRGILLGGALVHHLIPAIEACCASEGQVGLIRQFLRRAHLKGPRDVARDLHRASRSLGRECARRGLRAPRALHRAVRVLATVHWAARTGLPFTHAAPALGYAEVKSFRRAAKAAFAAAPSARLAEWGDPSRAADRVARGFLRRAS